MHNLSSTKKHRFNIAAIAATLRICSGKSSESKWNSARAPGSGLDSSLVDIRSGFRRRSVFYYVVISGGIAGLIQGTQGPLINSPIGWITCCTIVTFSSTLLLGRLYAHRTYYHCSLPRALFARGHHI